MKKFEHFPKHTLGASADGMYIARSGARVALLVFSDADGPQTHSAFICDEPVILPDHFYRTFTGENWLKIYDDRGLSFQVRANTIDIYRAGTDLCVIITIYN